MIKLSGLSRPTLYLAALLALSGCGDTTAPAQTQEKREKKAVAVTALTVQPERIAQALVRTGTLRARKSVRLHSQEEGRVLALPVYEGDKVEAGALLVRMDDRLLQAELNKAEANRRQAADDYARIQRLATRKLISEDERLRAATQLQVAESEVTLLKTRLGYTHITAPFAGVVSERKVEPGDAVPRFAHLVSLIDPQSLITEVSVSELVLPDLQQVGLPVKVRIDALGTTTYSGRIERVHPTVDAGTRQGIVEIAIDPVPNGAQAGQLCRVYLPGEVRERRMIPLPALRRDHEGEYVYIIDADDTAQRVAVISGGAIDARVEILDGIKDGDRVIIRGFIEVSAGKRVEIIDHVTPTGAAESAQ